MYKESRSDYRYKFPISEICKKNPRLKQNKDRVDAAQPKTAIQCYIQCLTHSTNPALTDLIHRMSTPNATTIACTRNRSTPLHVMCRNPNSVSNETAQVIIDCKYKSTGLSDQTKPNRALLGFA